jgi:hypothetical protein
VRRRVDRGSGPGVATVGRLDHLGDRRWTAAGEPAGRREQLVLADLGLQAADRAAPAAVAGAVDHHVPDLAGEPDRAAQGDAADEEPATDADASAQVGDVVRAHRDATQVLGPGTQVGVVGGHHRQAELLAQHLGERLVAPPEVGREPHQPVALADRSRHRHADPDDARRRPGPDQLGAHLADGLDDARAVVLAALVVPGTPVQHHAAEADQRDRDPVDVERRRQHRHVLTRRDHQRRAPGPAAGPEHQLLTGQLLEDQSELLELSGEVADRAPVEAERRGQDSPGRGSLEVHPREQRAHVRAANRLLSEPGPS